MGVATPDQFDTDPHRIGRQTDSLVVQHILGHNSDTRQKATQR
jgi:hypothetical protein